MAHIPGPNELVTHHFCFFVRIHDIYWNLLAPVPFLHHVFCNMLIFRETAVGPISSTGASNPLCPAKGVVLVSLHWLVNCLVRRAPVDCPNNIYYSLIYLTGPKVESQMKSMSQQNVIFLPVWSEMLAMLSMMKCAQHNNMTWFYAWLPGSYRRLGGELWYLRHKCVGDAMVYREAGDM